MLLDESAIGPVEWTPTPLFEHKQPILSAWWSQDRSQLLYTSMEPLRLRTAGESREKRVYTKVSTGYGASRRAIGRS